MTRTPKHRIVAFTGRAGAGKSTFASALRSTVSGRVVRLSFADPIRDMLRPLLACYMTAEAVERVLHHSKEEPIAELGDVTARRLMQTLGTEWGRDMVAPHIWVRAGIKRCMSQIYGPNPAAMVIIDDCRNDDEAEAIRKNGGVVIRIVRAGATVAPDHRTERGVSLHLIDHTYHNIGQGTPTAATVAFLDWADRRGLL
jgi:energy-coupling factor transporter ATP-binding protein EcfA2